MKKRVLVIGGSMFVGRVFSILASRTDEFELHVVNRGRFPLNNLANVTEYKCDRHAATMLAHMVPDLKFDAVIDFCAYNQGEIEQMISAVGSRIKQYIYFSTASVYDPKYRKVKEEGDPLMPTSSEGAAVEEYLKGKLLLEGELEAAAAKTGIRYTILRPTFIYGPFNYAPRESWFVELIAKKHIVPVPVDATANFNFVYVKDVARALMKMVGDERAYDEIFNLAGPERVTYTRLISDFERYNGGSFDTREVTVEEVEREEIPLPFPLTEDDLTNGEKLAKTLDFTYTPFSEGMEDTFKIFYDMYTT
ncbi:MAG: NAD-dependent epimerase/dehydratase family protein [Oscillospiraceae bacterium]|jgi:nucleoside-diphosphate-sugar epimerase|nr:NAD-dependent epimerase/dehydratase family protein [Oscillospiraceae bacterium]